MHRNGLAALGLVALLAVTGCSLRDGNEVPATVVASPDGNTLSTDAGEQPDSQESADAPDKQTELELPAGWRTHEFHGLEYDLPGNWSEERGEVMVTYVSEDGPGLSLSVMNKEQANAAGQGNLDDLRDALLANYEALDSDSTPLKIGDFDAVRVDIVDRTAFVEDDSGILTPTEVDEWQGRVMHYVYVDLGDRFLTCVGMYTEQWSDAYGPDMKQVMESLRVAAER